MEFVRCGEEVQTEGVIIALGGLKIVFLKGSTPKVAISTTELKIKNKHAKRIA